MLRPAFAIIAVLLVIGDGAHGALLGGEVPTSTERGSKSSSATNKAAATSSDTSAAELTGARSTTNKRAQWVHEEDTQGIRYGLDGFGDGVQKYSAFGGSVVRAARATLSVAAPMAAGSQIARQTIFGIGAYAQSRRRRAEQRQQMSVTATALGEGSDGDSGSGSGGGGGGGGVDGSGTRGGGSEAEETGGTQVLDVVDGVAIEEVEVAVEVEVVKVKAEGTQEASLAASSPQCMPQRQQQQQQQQQGECRGVIQSGLGSGSGLREPTAVRLGMEQKAAAVDRMMALKGGATKAVSDVGVVCSVVLDTTIKSAILGGLLKLAVLSADVLPLSEDAKSFYMLCAWAILIFLSGLLGKLDLLPVSEAMKHIATFNIDSPLEPEFYTRLAKPSWNPPDWLFPVMWIPLKILQVFACYIMWEALPVKQVLSPAVLSFLVYKSLGDVWNIVFFRRKLIGWGAAVMIVYWLSTIGSIGMFYQVDPKAAYLFAPTAAWVTVATSLSFSVWRLNRNSLEAKLSKIRR